MRLLRTVAKYNAHIGIDAPRLVGCDVRSFRENMPHVRMRQPPFRHALYSVAWRVRGTNREISGEALESNVFFNAPYQIISWDIELDWDGYYAIFDEGFARDYMHVLAPDAEWACFANATSRPVDLPADDTPWFSLTFERLHAETIAGERGGVGRQRSTGNEGAVCGAFLHALLDVAGAHYSGAATDADEASEADHHARLVTRARGLTLEALTDGRGRPSPGNLAAALNVSTGHLNDVVRDLTNETTSDLIAGLVLAEAQRLLMRTDKQIQEIADHLGYSAPTHFSAFFRRETGQSARAWRRGN